VLFRVLICIPNMPAMCLLCFVSRYFGQLRSAVFVPEMRRIGLDCGYIDGVPSRHEDEVEHSFVNFHRCVGREQPDAQRMCTGQEHRQSCSTLITFSLLRHFCRNFRTGKHRYICVFDQRRFWLIRSQTFIPFFCMCLLKFRILRPIMKQKIFNAKKKGRPKTVARKQCCQIVLLPRHYAAISSVSLRPPSKADVSKQCLPITVFHPK
jgi:hypothetical protein